MSCLFNIEITTEVSNSGFCIFECITPYNEHTRLLELKNNFLVSEVKKKKKKNRGRLLEPVSRLINLESMILRQWLVFFRRQRDVKRCRVN